MSYGDLYHPPRHTGDAPLPRLSNSSVPPPDVTPDMLPLSREQIHELGCSELEAAVRRYNAGLVTWPSLTPEQVRELTVRGLEAREAAAQRRQDDGADLGVVVSELRAIRALLERLVEHSNHADERARGVL